MHSFSRSFTHFSNGLLFHCLCHFKICASRGHRHRRMHNDALHFNFPSTSLCWVRDGGFGPASDTGSAGKPSVLPPPPLTAESMDWKMHGSKDLYHCLLSLIRLLWCLMDWANVCDYLPHIHARDRRVDGCLNYSECLSGRVPGLGPDRRLSSRER